MVNFIKQFFIWLFSQSRKLAVVSVTPDAYPVKVKVLEPLSSKLPVESKATNQPAPVDLPPEPQKYLFDTPQNSRHSIRVICDEMGLSVYNKNVITACIEQESGFYNYKDGKPVHRDNYYKGKLSSTDWGICQINDTPTWHIGPGLAFPSVDYVLANPEEAVRYMVRMLKAGKIKLWVSYSSGEYEKYTPQNMRGSTL